MKLKQALKKYKDLIFITLLFELVLAIILFMLDGQYIYGCKVDWLSQHSVLPDYFRQTFYNTHNLFPEFSLNLGAGQNAYNFAYYGYCNPIILVSFLLPWIPMYFYIAASGILVLFASIFLFFYWIRSKKIFKTGVLYTATTIFGLAAPLIYHSHKQVMYMDYMPFLLLALIGVDRLLEKNKKGLLAVSITLMFLTSYFFAFSGMFVITIYAVFEYMQKKERGNEFTTSVKSFTGRYIFSALTGVLLSCMLTLPAFFAIVIGRGSGSSGNPDFASLFIPKFSVNAIFHSPYGIGTLGIFAIAVIAVLIFTKKKSLRFLAIALLLVSILPAMKFLLNGFLYGRNKSLIPFLPLVVLMIAFFMQGLVLQKFHKRKLLILTAVLLVVLILYLLFPVFMQQQAIYVDDTTTLTTYMQQGIQFVIDILLAVIFMLISIKINKFVPLYCYLIVASLFFTVTNNFNESLVSKTDANRYFNPQKREMICSVLDSDDSCYRTSDLSDSKYTCNVVYHPRFFSDGTYSSVINQNYLNLCNNELHINNPTVNGLSVTPTKDVLFDTLMGVKYVVTDATPPRGYRQVAQKGSYKMYKSKNAYSLAFASKHLMSLREYNTLSPEDKQLALLEYIVVDEDIENVYTSKLEKVNIDTSLGLQKQPDGYYHIDTQNESKVFSLNTADSLKDYIYIVRCHIKPSPRTGAVIYVNWMQNTLSAWGNAFPNQNYDFKFVASSSKDSNTLSIRFPKGYNFYFEELQVYKIRYDDVVQCRKNMTMMKNISFTDDCRLAGDISLKSDQWMTTTIPYDVGFKIYVDGKETEYQKTDSEFVGFPLKAGKHHIEIVFHAPFALVGKILSGIGLLLLISFYIKNIFRRKETSKKVSE